MISRPYSKQLVNFYTVLYTFYASLTRIITYYLLLLAHLACISLLMIKPLKSFFLRYREFMRLVEKRKRAFSKIIF